MEKNSVHHCKFHGTSVTSLSSEKVAKHLKMMEKTIIGLISEGRMCCVLNENFYSKIQRSAESLATDRRKQHDQADHSSEHHHSRVTEHKVLALQA